MRVAAVDCGTNSIRLLVSEDGRDLVRDLVITRLGQGVDASGEFHPDALARTFAAAEKYAGVLAELEVPVACRRFVATSAARDAQNRDEFFVGIEQRIGVRPEVISGDEEAALTFGGAVAALSAGRDPNQVALVMDIGGGSTELIVGTLDGRVSSEVSLNVGSVRIRERFLRDDPPNGEQVSAASAFIDELLDGSGVDFVGPELFVGVGGTATCLSAIAQGLEVYDRGRVHGSQLLLGELLGLAERLRSQTVAEIRDYPTMVSGRADVISSGSLIAERIAKRVGKPLTVSESDILDGIVSALLA